MAYRSGCKGPSEDETVEAALRVSIIFSQRQKWLDFAREIAQPHGINIASDDEGVRLFAGTANSDSGVGRIGVAIFQTSGLSISDAAFGAWKQIP